MAGRRLSLLRPFRMKKKKKKKKKEGPETSPAQQPEEMEQLYPLQEDSGRDQTQEQDRARGRFRRADQAFLKFMGIQRRKTRTSPTEVMAQPDTRLIKLTAKPYVGTAPTDRTMKSDPALNDHTRNSDTTLIDQRMKSDTSLTDDMTGAYSPSIDRMAISDIALTDDPTNSDTALPDLTAEANTATTEGITDTDPTPSDRAIDSPNWDFFEENGDSSSKQVPSRPDCGMAERSLSLCRLFRRKKEGPGVAPAQQPKEVEQSQPLQENPGRDRTEEQDPARGCWRFIGQMFRDFRGTAKADVSIKPKERTANTDTTPTQSLADAPGLDSSEERVVSAKVQAFMKNMHQRLTANMFPENRLFMDILRLTDTYPADVALTLLRCAPSCDRAAAIMWRTIALSETTVVRVLPTLLCVMEDWPQHSVSASDESNKDIFALAATRVVWEILQMIQCPEALMEYSPRLLVDLLFQVFISTEQMPEEVDTFWRRCWEGHRLARNPNRFAVLTMKTLLCRLQFENIVMAMERKRGWDTLLNSDTHHYAMGLLAREMRRASSPLCSPVALCLLGLLTREKPRWELPAMAFLVEVLVYLDVTDCGERILQLFSKHLQSECKERRRLALRGLVVLSKDPVMADGMQSLTQSLLDVLGDADGELVGMALSVFINEIQDRDIQISTPTALQLAEVLQPLFGNDKIHVQLLSIHLFRKVMELGVDEGKQPLKTHVIQSLLPLFFYWHDENQHVAEASWEVLIHALRFLKRRDLEQLVKKKQPWKFSECLLEKDRSRVADHLRQALPYLESPQEPLREAAIKFIGMAGRYMRGQKEELQLVMNALQRMTHDSAAVKSLAIKTLKMLRTAERPPSSLHSTSLKISSRMCGIEKILCGAAARGQRRTDPGNPV